MSARVSAAAVALCALAAVSAAAQVVDAYASDIIGTVRGLDGTPLAGAVVTAVNPVVAAFTLRVRTSATGAYVLGPLPWGQWRLQARCDDRCTTRAGVVGWFQPQNARIATVPGGVVESHFQLRAVRHPLAVRYGDAAFRHVDVHGVQALFDQAAAAEEDGDPLTALAHYQSVVGVFPLHAEAWLAVARLQLTEADQPVSALAAYDSLLRWHPRNREALLGRARLRRQRGDPTPADLSLLTQAAIEAAAAGGGSGWVDLYNQGEAAFAAGDLGSARAAFTAALDAAPDNPQVLLQLVRLSVASERYADARRYYAVLDAVHPDAEQTRDAFRVLPLD